MITQLSDQPILSETNMNVTTKDLVVDFYQKFVQSNYDLLSPYFRKLVAKENPNIALFTLLSDQKMP